MTPFHTPFTAFSRYSIAAATSKLGNSEPHSAGFSAVPQTREMSASRWGRMNEPASERRPANRQGWRTFRQNRRFWKAKSYTWKKAGNRNRRRGSAVPTNGVTGISHKRWQSKGNGHALTQRHELALRKARHPGTSTPLKVCESEHILRCRKASLEQTKKRAVAANVGKQLPHGALT